MISHIIDRDSKGMWLKISGSHCLYGHLQYAVPVILSADMPTSGLEDRIARGLDGEQCLHESHMKIQND